MNKYGKCFFSVLLGPSVTTQGRSRRDSDQSSHSNEVFSGGEDHKDDSHTQQTPVSPPVKDETPVKLVPAPPPKENIWEKRKVQQTSPPQKKEEPRASQATHQTAQPPVSPTRKTGSQSEESSTSAREPQNQSSKPPSQSSKNRNLPQNEVSLCFAYWLFSKKTSRYCHSPGIGGGVVRKL